MITPREWMECRATDSHLSQCARWNRRSDKCGTGHNKMLYNWKLITIITETIPNQRQNNKSQAAFIGVLIFQVKIVYYVACRWSGRPKVYNRSVSSCNVWSNNAGRRFKQFSVEIINRVQSRCMCCNRILELNFRCVACVVYNDDNVEK